MNIVLCVYIVYILVNVGITSPLFSVQRMLSLPVCVFLYIFLLHSLGAISLYLFLPCKKHCCVLFSVYFYFLFCYCLF